MRRNYEPLNEEEYEQKVLLLEKEQRYILERYFDISLRDAEADCEQLARKLKATWIEENEHIDYEEKDGKLL